MIRRALARAGKGSFRCISDTLLHILISVARLDAGIIALVSGLSLGYRLL